MPDRNRGAGRSARQPRAGWCLQEGAKPDPGSSLRTGGEEDGGGGTQLEQRGFHQSQGAHRNRTLGEADPSRQEAGIAEKASQWEHSFPAPAP